jgi:hypothetical protein
MTRTRRSTGRYANETKKTRLAASLLREARSITDVARNVPPNPNAETIYTTPASPRIQGATESPSKREQYTMV